MNLCARCGVNFRTMTQFDAHPCMTASLDPEATTVMRDRRRTSIVTMDRPGKPGGPDVIRLCDPECRDKFLLDLGIPGSGGGSAYPSRGEADVHVACSGRDYRVTWKRCGPSAQACDLCEPQWRYRADRVRLAREPTGRQLEARAAFAAAVRAKARIGESPAA